MNLTGIIEVEYRPHTLDLIICGLGYVFVVFATVSLGQQPTPDDILSEIVKWSWLAFVLIPSSCWMALFVRRWLRPRKIVLTEDSLIMPKSLLSSTEVTIPYAAITQLDTKCTWLGQQYIGIVHQGGSVNIEMRFLRSAKPFQKIFYLLHYRVRSARLR